MTYLIVHRKLREVSVQSGDLEGQRDDSEGRYADKLGSGCQQGTLHLHDVHYSLKWFAQGCDVRWLDVFVGRDLDGVQERHQNVRELSITICWLIRVRTFSLSSLMRDLISGVNTWS
jgi:hypothetical protein